MKLKRTDSSDADFIVLVRELDEYLADVDGDEHAYFTQFNGLDLIPNAVVAFDGEVAVGCGAFKPYTDAIAEIKRMFVRPEFRERDIGAMILTELEQWALELGYVECILETGHRQKAAVALYRKSGYEIIPNYDQYAGVASSVCMKKRMAAREKTAV